MFLSDKTPCQPRSTSLRALVRPVPDPAPVTTTALFICGLSLRSSVKGGDCSTEGCSGMIDDEEHLRAEHWGVNLLPQG